MATLQFEKENLTQYSRGSIREIIALAAPIFLIQFSTCLVGFFERILFSHFSISSLEASLNAVYILRLFQLPAIAVTMMGQAFVGYYNGTRQPNSIGSCVWQMIWFSLLSMLLIVPLSFYCFHLFFAGTEIETQVAPYFFLLSFSNFLFPMGTALSSFYLGRGKVKFITLTTLLVALLNAGLDFLLIYGVPSLIPPLGLKGAALATILSQGVFCTILLILFLNKSNDQTYATRYWQWRPKAFWHFISPSLPRAFGRLVLISVWAANSHVMVAKGGDYLLVLTIGGTIVLFLSFLGDGLLQALVVLVSNAFGGQDFANIKRILRSGLVFAWMIGLTLSLFLIFFPQGVLSLLSLPEFTHSTSLAWVWFHIMVTLMNALPLSVLLSAKDTLFLLFANLATWITGYLPVHLGITYFGLSCDKFWLLASTSMFVSTGLYFFRIYQKKWLQSPQELSLSAEKTNGVREYSKDWNG